MDILPQTWNNEWKKQIAVFLANLYKDCSNDHFIQMNLNSLLWQATTMTLIDNKPKLIKYACQPLWSEKAHLLYKQNNPKGKSNYKDLRHDHVVPRSVVKRLIEKSDKKYESIYNILKDYSHAIIITKDEDLILNKYGYKSSMPVNENKLTAKNAFCRYKNEDVQKEIIITFSVDLHKD